MYSKWPHHQKINTSSSVALQNLPSIQCNIPIRKILLNDGCLVVVFEDELPFLKHFSGGEIRPNTWSGLMYTRISFTDESKFETVCGSPAGFCVPSFRHRPDSGRRFPPPPHDVVGHLHLLSVGVVIVVPLLEHVSVFDGWAVSSVCAFPNWTCSYVPKWKVDTLTHTFKLIQESQKCILNP